MKFQDITHDNQTHYRIDQGGEQVFFFVNRNGELVFDVLHPEANVRIIGLYRGKKNERFSLSTTQHHTTPGSQSHLILKSALSSDASMEHHGTIRIEPGAHNASASMESRHLLLDPGSRASAKPQLEILADEVLCSHAVTTSPLNTDLLAYLTSRTLDPSQAARLLTEGFLIEPVKDISPVAREKLQALL